MAFNKPDVNVVWANTGSVLTPVSSKINQGWVAEIPDFEFENWIQNRQDQFNAHVNQYGIPVWDAVTEYQANKSYVQGSNGIIYRALTTNTNKDPLLNATDWVQAFNAVGYSYSKAESDGKYLIKSNNLGDLTNSATARANLNVYSKTESDSAYLAASNNLSDIPDKITARNNLGVYAKTESDFKYLVKVSNLSDLTNYATARANLGVYSKSESLGIFVQQNLLSLSWGSLQITGYINNYDGAMNYSLGTGYVMVGLNSIHSNSSEDRIWRIYYRYVTV